MARVISLAAIEIPRFPQIVSNLDIPAHLDALKRAYERFPQIGGRAAT